VPEQLLPAGARRVLDQHRGARIAAVRVRAVASRLEERFLAWERSGGLGAPRRKPDQFGVVGQRPHAGGVREQPVERHSGRGLGRPRQEPPFDGDSGERRRDRRGDGRHVLIERREVHGHEDRSGRARR
jgi:hypothetical protein